MRARHVVRLGIGGRIVVRGLQPDRSHADPARSGDIGPTQVAHVDRVASLHAEGLEGGLEDARVGLGQAPLVGEDRLGERREQSMAVEQLAHDPPRREPGIADQRAADARLFEARERLEGPLDHEHPARVRGLLEGLEQGLEGRPLGPQVELLERPARDLSGARGHSLRPQIHVPPPGRVERATRTARLERATHGERRRLQRGDTETMSGLPARLEDQRVPAIEGDRPGRPLFRIRRGSFSTRGSRHASPPRAYSSPARSPRSQGPVGPPAPPSRGPGSAHPIPWSFFPIFVDCRDAGGRAPPASGPPWQSDDSGKPSATVRETPSKALERAVLTLLRPLIRLVLKRGMAYGQFAELVKRAYVDSARTDFGVPGRKLTISRVAVLTGL